MIYVSLVGCGPLILDLQRRGNFRVGKSLGFGELLFSPFCTSDCFQYRILTSGEITNITCSHPPPTRIQ